MSVKLYHGYHLPQIHTLHQACQWRRRLQEKFHSTCTPRLAQEVAQKACAAIDAFTTRLFFTGKPQKFPKEKEWTDNNALALARESTQKALEENGRLRDHYRLTLTLFQTQTQGRSYTLCLLHGNSRYVDEFFAKHGQAKPFPYWNNADQPENLTTREWNLRGDLWGSVLLGPGRSGTPSQEGFLAQSEEPTFFLWDIRKQAPRFLDRRKRAWNAVFNHLVVLALEGIPSDQRLSEFMDICDRIRESPRVDRLAKVLEPHLPQLHSWRCLQNFTLPTKLAEPKHESP